LNDFSINIKNKKFQQTTFLLLTILITVLCFLPSIHSFFVTDDFFWLYYYGGKSWGEVPQKIVYFFTHPQNDGFYRPVTDVFFCFDFLIWKINPIGYHITNLFLHISVTTFLFYWCKKFVTNTWAACFGTLFFALHPLHTDAVTYISGRTELVFSFFFFVSIYFTTRYIVRGSKKDMFLGLIGYFLSQYSKETAIVMIPIVFFLPMCLKKTAANCSSKIIKRKNKSMLGLSLIAISYMAWRQLFVGAKLNRYGWDIGSESILRFFYNSLLTFVPINLQNLGVAPYDSISTSILVFLLVVGVVGTGTLFFFLIRMLDRDDLYTISFFLLWVTFSFFPILFMSGARYSYLPSAGTSVIVGIVIFNVLDKINNKFKKKYAYMVMAGFSIPLFLFFSTRITERNKIYTKVGNTANKTLSSIRTAFTHPSQDAGIYLVNMPLGWVCDQESWLRVFNDSLRHAVRVMYGKDISVFISRKCESKKEIINFLRINKINEFLRENKEFRIFEYLDRRVVDRTKYYTGVILICNQIG